jgi:hypothetical protein
MDPSLLYLLYFIDSAPIIYQDQHIGFNMIMSGVNFVTIKGASHQVPQSKRP